MKNMTWYIAMIFLVSCSIVSATGSLQIYHDSTAKENIAIRVFNHDYKAAVTEVLYKLDKAQLEQRGFTKTIVEKTIATGGNKPVKSTVLQFNKQIPCSRLFFVEEEIRRLWPEAWGPEVSKRVVTAVSRAMDFGGKICTAGIEVHLPPRGGCAARKEKRGGKECTEWCLFCFSATTEA